jgi:hypothetical protein
MELTQTPKLEESHGLTHGLRRRVEVEKIEKE